MNLNRDEFLLLSRTGRGPHTTRAGPSFEPTGTTPKRLFRKRRTSGLSLAGRAPWRVRHMLGPRARGSQRPLRTKGYLNEHTYHELEFLVEFPIEEETLL